MAKANVQINSKEEVFLSKEVCCLKNLNNQVKGNVSGLQGIEQGKRIFPFKWENGTIIPLHDSNESLVLRLADGKNFIDYHIQVNAIVDVEISIVKRKRIWIIRVPDSNDKDSEVSAEVNVSIALDEPNKLAG
jgi:hypothetical protein